jgi:DNA (cytosine-5)-methyltransferase 1
MQPCSVVDLFCGAGGLTKGFLQEGFHVAAGIDIDEGCRYPYEANNAGAKFIHKGVETLTPAYLNSLFQSNRLRVLVGCAPCQPFSKYTQAQSEDSKWSLLRAFGKLIRSVRPEIVSMENVPELQKHLVFEDFVETLEDEGYVVTKYIVNCTKYGVPQNRTRLVLFASKFGPIQMVKPTHTSGREKHVRDVLQSLEPIAAGGVSKKDPLHRARGLNELNLMRIRSTPEGGDWRDWPARLVLKCHKKATGKTYRSVYGRMSWDEPAPTMTTHCTGLGNGRFGHPEQDRAISLREAAILQAFPIGYKFIEPGVLISTKRISRQIGNAVPVRLGRMIARSIRIHLENLSAKTARLHSED